MKIKREIVETICQWQSVSADVIYAYIGDEDIREMRIIILLRNIAHRGENGIAAFKWLSGTIMRRRRRLLS